MPEVGDFVTAIEGVAEAEGGVGMEEIVETIGGAVADVHQNVAIHTSLIRRGSDPRRGGPREF